MVRWVLPVICLVLAGCAEPVPDDEPILLVMASHEADAPLYDFVLYAKDVSDTRPNVTFRIFVDGQIGSFVAWEADEHTTDYGHVKSFQIGGSTLSFDIVYEGDVISGGTLDLSECPDGEGDAFVRIMDMYRARADYGCRVDGYEPEE